MKCLYGHAEMEPGTIAYTETRNGYVLVLQEVPAMICPLCGEELLSEETVESIQSVIRSLDKEVAVLRQRAQVA